MSEDVDVIIVGAGINGMVAAAELGKAGWSVMLVDENPRLGGFIETRELTIPGYRHDVYSSFHPMFVSSEAYRLLGPDLHRLGLEYLNTDGIVSGTVSERGVAVAYRDPARTAAGLSVAADRDAYLQMLGDFGRFAPQIFGLLGSELSPGKLTRLAWGSLRAHGPSGSLELVRLGVQSGRAFIRERFVGYEVDQMWIPWLLHGGLLPDSASGGVQLPLFAAAMHGFGMPVVKGGAGNFVAAFERLLTEYKVRFELGAAVTGIDVEGGRAVGVRIGSRQFRARRAVIASVVPGQLYNELLPKGAVKEKLHDRARRYRPGKASAQIHIALDGPVPWTDPRLGEMAALHITNGSDSSGIASAQALAGLLPAEPTIVVGQQHVLDPGRVPDGKALLWLQLHELPNEVRGDAAGEIDPAGSWDNRDLVDAYAARVLARIERFAPGLRALVKGVTTLSPRDLQAANRNAIGGDPYAGSAELDQNLLWRPLSGASSHLTPVKNLWQIGGSTHPGGGLGGVSGHLTAQQLLGKK